MATLTPVNAARTGIDFITNAVAATSGGDSFANTGRELLIIANGDVSDMTLTIVTPSTLAGQAVADRTVTVPAGKSRLIGPFPPGVYNNAAGAVDLTYSAVTSLTVYVVRVP